MDRANVGDVPNVTPEHFAVPSLDRLSVEDPALAQAFHASVAGLLARRLTRTTALLREVSR